MPQSYRLPIPLFTDSRNPRAKASPRKSIPAQKHPPPIFFALAAMPLPPLSAAYLQLTIAVATHIFLPTSPCKYAASSSFGSTPK